MYKRQTVHRNVVLSSESLKTTQTTIPFIKDNEFDYGWLTGGNTTMTWLLYVLVAIFVVTAVSNGANLTDGLDGLATGVSVPIVAVLGVLAYLSGHIVYADYLDVYKRQVQILRERSIRLQEQRYRRTTHSAIVERLRERDIELTDPPAPGEIIEN